MSIKKLFGNHNSSGIQIAQSSQSASLLVESSDYIEAKRKQHEEFVPPLDFTTASNFAKFGSAELYYEYAFKRIYQYYPYDGTLAEKVEFENSSSYIDKYIFDNIYPRTNGYIYLNGSNYIKTLGGPHTASAGMAGKLIHNTFDDSMLYSPEDKRTSAFEISMVSGSTVEFWLQRSASVSSVETIFDMWNGELASADEYGRMKIFASGSNNSLRLTMMSGAVGWSDLELLQSAFTDNTWHHFALTVVKSSSNTDVKLYKDNTKVYDASIAASVSDIKPVSKGINATIGASVSTEGDNKLTGYMDEFRFWKKARTHEAIANTWFIPVGGGTNKYDANIDLGVYYKFNEGITGVSTTDSSVLDYSGRIHNGTWISYAAGQRNTGSAIVESGVADREFQDPIIYSSHPTVSASLAEYKTSGSLADNENSSTIFNYFPAWMQESDEQNGKNLKYLSQIIGSYFDNLYHQINYVDKIHSEQYVSGTNSPLPFAKKLLYNKGFVVPNMFVDATVTEALLNKDENEVYEKEINDVRNTIYHNLYNNMLGIYKSKGTEKSFRNFFRSLGINSELVKLKMYADDSTFVLRDNYEYKSYARKFLNFNYEGHFDATVFHNSSSAYGNTANHIPAGQPFDSFTLESELILPRKNRSNEPGYIDYPYVTSSVFGYHSASSGSPFHWAAADLDLNVYVIKEKLESQYGPEGSQRIKFALTSNSGSGVSLRSPWYDYQYENNKWNLAVKVKSNYYPNINVSGATTSGNSYTLEFYGVEADANIKRNSFIVSSSVGNEFVESRKRIYGGAERTNCTGSVVKYSDIKLGYIRYWHSYMSNAAIDQHAFDSETYGINEPFETDLINTGSTIDIPREKTLALYWGFNNLTSADSAGELRPLDLSSGSTGRTYGSTYSQIIDRYNSARAYGFPASSTNALDKNYLYIARKRQPDDLLSSDLTTIKSDATEQFFVDDDVSDNFYSFEKSMYGVISDEMLNMFSTAVDFNNLIGQPNQRYHHEYKLLSFLKDRFFDDVENEPDIERFTNFYKWIDDAISKALQQLTPASARFSEKIGNVIESHVLERNKYTHKIPLLTRFSTTEGTIAGVNELLYDWQFGHAPLNLDREDKNCLWQKERREKTGTRETIRKIKNNNSFQSSGLIRVASNGAAYLADPYNMRKIAKPYKFDVVTRRTIHGGVNFDRDKNIFLFQESVSPGSEVVSVPQNVVTVGLKKGVGIMREVDCIDGKGDNKKKKFNFTVEIGNKSGREYESILKGNSVLPLNLVSGTVHTGYNKKIKSRYRSNVILTNLHNDIYAQHNDIPMQGPFTETHVGGVQYRHIPINRYNSLKSVSVSKAAAAVKATGLIEFTSSALVFGDNIRILDADRTPLTASYSSYYDLLDKKWTQASELISIINYNLDTTAVLNRASPVIISLTASLAGTDANVAMVSSGARITVSGFSAGANPAIVTTTVNLDGPANRPEGWGLAFKEHPSMNDTDGAFGFLPADYGSGDYPNPLKIKATRFREEHAKRPVNVKNIQYDSNSETVGNYRKGYEIVCLEKSDQRRWYREAYDENKVLPASIRSKLPNTTNYMTLAGQAPFLSGNVFGGSTYSNRQPDATLLISTPGVAGVNAKGSFSVLGKQYISTSDRITIGDKSWGITGHGGSTYTVATGSSDAQFWQNLTASIRANTSYTVNHTTQALAYSKAIKITRRNASSLTSSITLSERPAGAFTFSCWLKPDGSSANRYLYRETTYGNKDRDENNAQYNSRLIRIDNNGDLRFNLSYYASGSTDYRVDQYYRSGYLTEFGTKQAHHIVWTHSGSMDSTTQGHLYVDGIKQSLLTNAGGGTGTKTQNIPTDIVLLNSRSDGSASNTLSTSGSGGRAAIDEIIILNSTASQAMVTALYGCGKRVNVADIYDTVPSASLVQYYSFEGPEKSTGQSISGLGIRKLDLGIISLNSCFDMISGSDGACISTFARADISLTASVIPRASGNATITPLAIECPAFFNAVNLQGGVTAIIQVEHEATDIVIPVPRTDLTSSTFEINTRFSAPGGPEIQSIGYLDAQSSTYSVHNAMPFRNLTVLNDSGEAGTIRVNDHLNRRRGHKTLLSLPMGKFGTDYTYGSVTSTAYPSNGSFNKQHSNISRRFENSGSSIITGSAHDNLFISSPIPRSEFQYGWINSAISSVPRDRRNQRILGYAPPSGEISSSSGYVDAIIFPTISTIQGS